SPPCSTEATSRAPGRNAARATTHEEPDMLKRLEFKAVGPAPEMQIAFAPRLNLIAGDNGLGKSFLLDTAWWALTRTWARRLVVPHLPPAVPSVTFAYTKRT